MGQPSAGQRAGERDTSITAHCHRSSLGAANFASGRQPTADTARGRRYGMLRAGCSAATGLPGLLSTFVRGPALRTNSLPGLQPNAQRRDKTSPSMMCGAHRPARGEALFLWTLAHPMMTHAPSWQRVLVPHSCLSRTAAAIRSQKTILN